MSVSPSNVDASIDRYIDANVDVYFVRHAESCSNISNWKKDGFIGKIIHPPLSYKGMQQAINLGINNEIINMKFDEYYCSPSLRTIMTACLALRRTCYTQPITLYLNSYLIENKNTAKYFGFISKDLDDQQNSVVPKANLKNMIKYIKEWFREKYFDNYIDYEFVHMMYDLIIIFYLNKKFQLLLPFIQKLLLPVCYNRKLHLINLLNELIKIKIDLEKTILNKEKVILQNNKTGNIYDIYDNIILLIKEHENEQISKNFTIYQDQNTNNILDYKKIIEQLTLFSSKELDLFHNITLNYEYIETNKANIKQFISDVINNKRLNGKKILCFSHGSTLKTHFDLKEKLENTEIVYYNNKNKKTETILNNNIIINKKIIKETCGNFTSEFYMFEVINKYFNNNNYKIFNNIKNSNKEL